MSAKDLIETAGKKGYFTGRYKPGQYYYGYSDGSGIRDFSFSGSYAEFCKFIVSLPSVK